MFWKNKEEKENDYNNRSHQDNFWSESAFNNEWQYCKHCNKNTRFEYDRCVICKSN